MATKIPVRKLISTPTDIEGELSADSKSMNCYGKQRFSKALQEYLVDYALMVIATPLVMSDYPEIKIQDKTYRG